MKLLITTQVVDEKNQALGFFLDWIREFAKRYDMVTVICLYKGKYVLPENVRVLSLGKETGASRAKYIYRFFQYVWRERKNYNEVFLHMGEYYGALGGWLFRLLHKKSALWYVHKQNTLLQRIALYFVDYVFTSVPESFRIDTPKKICLGHGVLFEKFARPHSIQSPSDTLRIVSVGRITPIKNLETLIRAASILNTHKIDFHVSLVGEPVYESDKKYKAMLVELIHALQLENKITFVGSVPHEKVAEQYWYHDISVNLCPTGGLDKAVIESVYAGAFTFVANTAFEKFYGPFSKETVFVYGDSIDLAEKIITYYKKVPEVREQEKKSVLKIFRSNFDLPVLISNIVKTLSTKGARM